MKTPPLSPSEMTFPTSLPATETQLPKIYQAGSLRYTRRDLFVLFLWLLGGDFAFTFFENIFGRFMPLYLNDLHASNSLIGIMTGSLAGFVNIFFLPNISQWSDHYRSPFGRRIPFLYAVTPLAVVSLMAVGFAPEIAGWLQSRLIVHLAPSLPAATIVLILLCLLAASFHFFNMVLTNAYTWLLRDVVPLELMARFLSWFRFVGTASSFVFLWYVFPFIIARRQEVFLGVGFFYLGVFLLMCRNVKEGEYPPAPAREDRPGIFKSFGLYFRECLGIPLYRNFFIVFILIGTAGCTGPFAVLFARETLGLTMEDMGKIFAWGALASAVAYLPIGWLCDRFSPIRVTLVSLIGLGLAAVPGFLLVRDRNSFLIYTTLCAIPWIGWGLGSQATAMRLFPAERFGQFSSGLNVFSCGAFIFGNYLVGQFMDLVHSNYRMTFVWSGLLLTLAIYPMVLVHRGWKQHGGLHHYEAPLPSSTVG